MPLYMPRMLTYIFALLILQVTDKCQKNHIKKSINEEGLLILAIFIRL